MIRENDPRLAEVLAVFDRFASSWTREHKDVGGNMLDIYVASVVLRYGHTGVDDFPGWTDDAMRAVLLAYLLNAPISAFVEMHREARHRLRWLVDFEKCAEFEHSTEGEGVTYRDRLPWGAPEAVRS